MFLACSLPGSGGWSAARAGIRSMTSGTRPCRMSSAWAITQSSMAGSRGGVEAPGCLPQVFQHVNEVDHDGQRDPPARGLCLEQAELVVVPVDQGDPGPSKAGVAAVGLGEDLPAVTSGWR